MRLQRKGRRVLRLDLGHVFHCMAKMASPPLRRLLYISLLIMICISGCRCSEENDLWLLLSSYEDMSITVDDLAFFLVTHGYNAEPAKIYVTVTFSSGKKVYLTPNGASPRLADLWMDPPTSESGPIQVLAADAIKKNMTYAKTSNPDFIKTISRYTVFPVAPLGMCFDGSQKLAELYNSFNYKTKYLYDPNAGGYSQGHLWIAIEDTTKKDTWLAVDSYYGPMASNEYYFVPYSFDDIKYLDSINPQWKIS
jgi:hypothetical protein